MISAKELLNGATLEEGESLVTPNNKYHLDMQKDGNLVLYRHADPLRHIGKGRDIWNSGTYNKGSGPYKLVMQTDHNLVVYQGNGGAIWASGTREDHPGRQGRAVAILQNDGNFVVYGNHGNFGKGADPKWSTNTYENRGK